MDYSVMAQHPTVRRLVYNFIGMDRIKASTDLHFNDIPLDKWDCIAELLSDNIKRQFVQDYDVHPCLATWVCIMKEAARQMKEEA